MAKFTKPLESTTRIKINNWLVNLGWEIDENSPNCNCFTERARTVDENKKFKTKVGFPDLTSHLLAIKNNNVKCKQWLDHCQYQPFDFYNPGFTIHRLEKFDKFLNYLDKNCKKDYEPLSNFQLNKQETIPYPNINDFEENLIIELTKAAADHTKYDIPKSISVYRERYNSGELNELFKSHVWGRPATTTTGRKFR